MRNAFEKSYLTKRLLVSKSQKAVKLASSVAFDLAGSIVKKEGNQIVREFKDGRVIVLLDLPDSSNFPLALD